MSQTATRAQQESAAKGEKSHQRRGHSLPQCGGSVTRPHTRHALASLRRCAGPKLLLADKVPFGILATCGLQRGCNLARTGGGGAKSSSSLSSSTSVLGSIFQGGGVPLRRLAGGSKSSAFGGVSQGAARLCCAALREVSVVVCVCVVVAVDSRFSFSTGTVGAGGRGRCGGVGCGCRGGVAGEVSESSISSGW